LRQAQAVGWKKIRAGRKPGKVFTDRRMEESPTMKWLVLLLSLIIVGGVSVAGWFYTKHKKAEAARLAWEQKIDECIVQTLREQRPIKSEAEHKSEAEDVLDNDTARDLVRDMQVEQARNVCISNDTYNQEHKHDRELYERAFPQPRKN
jgi:uncharacterized membrane protein